MPFKDSVVCYYTAGLKGWADGQVRDKATAPVQSLAVNITSSTILHGVDIERCPDTAYHGQCVEVCIVIPSGGKMEEVKANVSGICW
jgi:hypothetical protein